MKQENGRRNSTSSSSSSDSSSSSSSESSVQQQQQIIFPMNENGSMIPNLSSNGGQPNMMNMIPQGNNIPVTPGINDPNQLSGMISHLNMPEGMTAGQMMMPPSSQNPNSNGFIPPIPENIIRNNTNKNVETKNKRSIKKKKEEENNNPEPVPMTDDLKIFEMSKVKDDSAKKRGGPVDSSNSKNKKSKTDAKKKTKDLNLVNETSNVARQCKCCLIPEKGEESRLWQENDGVCAICHEFLKADGKDNKIEAQKMFRDASIQEMWMDSSRRQLFMMGRDQYYIKMNQLPPSTLAQHQLPLQVPTKKKKNTRKTKAALAVQEQSIAQHGIPPQMMVPQPQLPGTVDPLNQSSSYILPQRWFQGDQVDKASKLGGRVYHQTILPPIENGSAPLIDPFHSAQKSKPESYIFVRTPTSPDMRAWLKYREEPHRCPECANVNTANLPDGFKDLEGKKIFITEEFFAMPKFMYDATEITKMQALGGINVKTKIERNFKGAQMEITLIKACRNPDVRVWIRYSETTVITQHSRHMESAVMEEFFVLPVRLFVPEQQKKVGQADGLYVHAQQHIKYRGEPEVCVLIKGWNNPDPSVWEAFALSETVSEEVLSLVPDPEV